MLMYRLGPLFPVTLQSLLQNPGQARGRQEATMFQLDPLNMTVHFYSWEYGKWHSDR